MKKGYMCILKNGGAQMKRPKFLLFLIMILPWFTLPLLGGKAIKRFLPAAIFISIVSKVIDIIAEKRKWWKYYTTIHPLLKGSAPLVLGPFFASAFWSLKNTYGKFVSYLISNLLLHIAFATIGMWVLKRLRITSLDKMSRVQLVFVLLFRALVLYGFQFVKESMEKRRDNQVLTRN